MLTGEQRQVVDDVVRACTEGVDRHCLVQAVAPGGPSAVAVTRCGGGGLRQNGNPGGNRGSFGPHPGGGKPRPSVRRRTGRTHRLFAIQPGRLLSHARAIADPRGRWAFAAGCAPPHGAPSEVRSTRCTPTRCGCLRGNAAPRSPWTSTRRIGAGGGGATVTPPRGGPCARTSTPRATGRGSPVPPSDSNGRGPWR